MTVYFIQDGEDGQIKIGFSRGNPHARLSAFRTGNPRDLRLLVAIPGGLDDEKSLHRQFAALRTQGEWFRPEPHLLGFVAGLLHAYRDRQPPAEPPMAEAIFGLTNEHLEAVVGAAKGAVLCDRIARWRSAVAPSLAAGLPLSPHEAGDAGDLEDEAVMFVDDTGHEGAGARYYSMVEHELQFLRKDLERHRHLIAERLLAEDYHECVNPNPADDLAVSENSGP